MNYKKKKILLSGGGTLGSVTPLLAIVDELRKENVNIEYLWLGTKNGPERQMVQRENINFKTIQGGKLRRYFSFKNIIDIFKIKWAFLQSLIIIFRFRPNLMLSAGGFVGVPVILACWIFRVPIFIHQQDAKPGLANKLMASFAKVITVTFEKSLKDYGKKAIWTGNLIRKELLNNKIDKRTAIQKLGLRSRKPVVLVMGGGTGATAINELVRESIPELTKFCQIIHLTGKDKGMGFAQISAKNADYKNFEFLNIEGMIKVYTVADAIVTRAGMNALTEISFLEKPSIIIPIPDSHQGDNAKVFKDLNAAIVLNQEELDADIFIEKIRSLVMDVELHNRLHGQLRNIIKREANEKIIKLIKKTIKI